MRVWLIQRSEPTPLDTGGSQRPLRMGILAKMLVEAGHSVVWWTSTFNHYSRVHRYDEDARVVVEDGYEIQFLRGCGYKKNVSIDRFRENDLLARRFKQLAPREILKPDVILSSLPTAELGMAAIKYAEPYNIPVILDIRDLWPDVFADIAPTGTGWLASLVAAYFRRPLRATCSKANAIIGLTDEFVNWGISYSGRQRQKQDRVFPMGYISDDNIAQNALEEQRAYWRDKKVIKKKGELLAVFFGNFGRTNDLDVIIDAARALENHNPAIKFVLCGAGENFDRILKKSGGLSNVTFPGWVNGLQIKTLLEIADVGFTPYISSKNYIYNIPNKPAEILSGSVPIALSLGEGALFDMVNREQIGFSYGDSADRLVEQLRELSAEPEKLVGMKSNARQVFMNEFDGSAIYSDLIDYLSQMVEEASNPDFQAAS